MRIKRAFVGSILMTLPAAAVQAQDPLSVIDWLTAHPAPAEQGGFRPSSGNLPPISEPPVTQSAQGPDISVVPLEQSARAFGLAPYNVTGLSSDIWSKSNLDTLTRLIKSAPVQDSPAMQSLLYTLLLAEAYAPDGQDIPFLMTRMQRLMELGAVDPAQALGMQADPRSGREAFAQWFDAALLTGDEEMGCEILGTMPYLSADPSTRIFCTARNGDWSTAALMLENASILGDVAGAKFDLLDRFLNADFYENAPPLPVPARPTPLDFRLFEAIGERLPTAPLPRAFAHADLRDIAGWKAQVEAAERLSRSGALSPNQLLGLYTARLPAASGGVWDRIEAIQRFETALKTRSPNAVEKTLPGAWDAMRAAKTEASFATLFAEQLSKQRLNKLAAKQLAFQMLLLSPDYEIAAQTPPDSGETTQFLSALAKGIPQSVPAPDARAQAIADGFSDDIELPLSIQTALDDGRTGEAILRIVHRFDRGARGNLGDLTLSLSAMRQLNLESTARRAALHLLVLNPA